MCPINFAFVSYKVKKQEFSGYKSLFFEKVEFSGYKSVV